MNLSAGQPYAIAYAPAAVKELGRIDRTTARRIKVAIDALAADPRPSGARTLTGYRHFWRMRVGDYRVIYSIDDARVTVLVIHIAHRREVYRALGD